MHRVQGMGRVAVGRARAGAIVAATAVAVVVVDQATKAAVRVALAPLDTVPVVDGFFNITHVRNLGAAFGIMPGRQGMFVITSTLVVFGIAVFVLFGDVRRRASALALGLVGGGALGNLIDRVSGDRRVTDMLEIQFRHRDVFPVFNAADSAIVVGVACLALMLLFERESDPDEGDEGRA